MGILLNGLFINAIVVAIVIWLVNRRLRRSSLTFRKKQLVRLAVYLPIGALAIGLAPLTAGGLIQMTTRQGTHVARADYVGEGFPLPQSAGDIDYFRNLMETQAAFSVPEGDFMAWAAKHQIELEDGNSTVELERLGIRLELDEALSGLVWLAARGTHVSVTYDRANERCYYRYVAW